MTIHARKISSYFDWRSVIQKVTDKLTAITPGKITFEENHGLGCNADTFLE